MNKLIVLPYRNGSKSAKALAQALGCKQMKLKGSKWRWRLGKLIVNWGNGQNVPANTEGAHFLNLPAAVRMAGNKLDCFRAMGRSGISIPAFTSEKGIAEKWIDVGRTVVCRTKLNGHSGEGIVLASTVEELVDAPLYVLYIPKKQEYRIHVFQGTVIDQQRKARKMDQEEVNWQIRNHANGFVFARNEEHDYPEQVFEQAVRAVEACGLDFGAVDIIYNEKEDKAYVLEINTACGLEGETINSYVEAINGII